jgi:hypothetical protein
MFTVAFTAGLSPSQVDFSKLGLRTLKRYKRRYRLKVRPNSMKPELAQAIAAHFGNHRVEEADVLDFFIYAAKTYKDSKIRDD